jgi:FtsZ-binding cell division protein ZapB
MIANSIALDKALADKLTELKATERTAATASALFAATIRNQYMDASGKKYAPEFVAFWKKFSMEKRFGSLQNFSKYANAGDAIEKVRAQFDKYEKNLPTTLTALYEFAQLTDEEMELCLETTYSRPEVTSDRTKWKSPKAPKPLITPSVTAGAIKSWRMNWRNPKAPNTDKRRLKIAEIKVHGSLFDFKDGKPQGIISLEKLAEITEAIKKVISDFPDTIIRLDLEDEKLKEGYNKRLAKELEKSKKKAEELKKNKAEKPKKKFKKPVKRLKSA